ncbi:MAG: hypothetical protein FWC93_01245 [Defluviitaleaceae bacterium]|nr:hypothetical protein [Defluviitaleaceae bacterium]
MMMKKMLTKLKTDLARNTPWKIAAFLLAFALWFLIMNITDPILTLNVPVTLQLRNEEALDDSIHLENINALRYQQIRIRVRGSSSDVEELRNSLGAYIDLSTSDIINAAEEGVVLNVVVQPAGDFGDDIELVSISPASVSLHLDKIETRQIPIDVEMIGEVDVNHLVLYDDIDIMPPTLPVTGPRSIVGDIERLAIEMDIEGLTASARATKTRGDITILDGAGREVLSHYVGIGGTAIVQVPVYRRGSIAILSPEYEGTPPVGFGVYDIEWYPRTIAVAGPEEAIQALIPIRLSPIAADLITAATDTFNLPYDIRHYLPDGVFLIEDDRGNVNVEVLVEPVITREFVIPRARFQVFGLPHNTTVLTDEITLTVSGLETIVDGITNITLAASLGNLNLPYGRHNVPLNPSGISGRATIVGPPPMLTIYVAAPGEEPPLDIPEPPENPDENGYENEPYEDEPADGANGGSGEEDEEDYDED